MRGPRAGRRARRARSPAPRRRRLASRAAGSRCTGARASRPAGPGSPPEAADRCARRAAPPATANSRWPRSAGAPRTPGVRGRAGRRAILAPQAPWAALRIRRIALAPGRRPAPSRAAGRSFAGRAQPLASAAARRTSMLNRFRRPSVRMNPNSMTRSIVGVESPLGLRARSPPRAPGCPGIPCTEPSTPVTPQVASSARWNGSPATRARIRSRS